MGGGLLLALCVFAACTCLEPQVSELQMIVSQFVLLGIKPGVFWNSNQCSCLLSHFFSLYVFVCLFVCYLLVYCGARD